MKKMLLIFVISANLVLTTTLSFAQNSFSKEAKKEAKEQEAQKKQKYYYKIEDLPETVLIPEDNIKTRFLLGEGVLVSFIEVPAGTVFPVHSHDAEQILIILEGEEHHEINGDKFIMRAGDVAVHPPGVIHGGHPGPNGYKGIDIFTPPRKSHVQLMEEQGTLPNEYGEYKSNK
jgi:quercetin dioxygenase-like cupin family protein